MSQRLTEEPELDWGVGPSQHIDHSDSMVVSTTTVDDTCWMEVNNEPLDYDFPNTEDPEEDGAEVQMEIPDDDLCTTQIVARSVVVNLEFSTEKLSTGCVQNGFAVGMVFQSKKMFLTNLRNGLFCMVFRTSQSS